MTTVTRHGPGTPALRLAVTGAATIAVAYGFARYGFGLFVPVLRERFALSAAAVGLISSASYGTYLAGLLGAGVLARRRGPRLPVLIGAGAAALGTALVAVADRPAVLAAGVVLAASSPGWCWAPFSDATALLVPPRGRERVLAVISTGTTFGLIVAGPAALLTATSGSGWRWAWIGFAAAAGLAGLANLRLLPARTPPPACVEPAGRAWLRRPGAGRLLAQSAAYGAVGAVYFTFAVDLVRGAGLPPSWSVLLWTLVGLGGVTGVWTGALVDRFGLRRTLTTTTLLLAAAVAALAAAPDHAGVAAASAAAYGAAVMPIAALLAIWSARMYPDRPSSGFTAVLTALAVGAIAAAAVFGLLAEVAGLRVAFAVLAALTVPAALLRPARSAAAPSTRV
jgi:predicted MFS family arabinose efflux permease